MTKDLPENTPRTNLTHIAGWTLGYTLGRGAYAHVRLATNISGHKAACKILPALHRPHKKQMTQDEQMDAIEAHKEVVLLKALWGAGIKGIVGLEGVIEEGGWTRVTVSSSPSTPPQLDCLLAKPHAHRYVFLTLYPCSASTLKSPWPSDLLVEFFRRLLNTVHACHTLGISHEDIKRSNVLLDEKYRPTLVDFGFSHFRSDGRYVKSAGGTLDYSSPEKVADQLYDARATDVWALGIFLSKILGVQHPFGDPWDKTLKDDELSKLVKHRIMFEAPIYNWPTEWLEPGGPAELVEGMLNKDPEQRWTIPRILQHPLMADPLRGSTPMNRSPSYQLPKSFPRPCPTVILQDICFLVRLQDDFCLCESYKWLEEKLDAPFPCWEKQWAGLLYKWYCQRGDDWVDAEKSVVPPARKSVPSRDSALSGGAKRGPLREIHLSPNVSKVYNQQALPDSSPTKVNPAPISAVPARAKPVIANMRARPSTDNMVSTLKAQRLPPPAPAPLRVLRLTKPKGPVLTKTTEITVVQSPRKPAANTIINPDIPLGGFGRARRPAVKTASHSKIAPSQDLSGLRHSMGPVSHPPWYATDGAPSAAPSNYGSDDEGGVTAVPSSAITSEHKGAKIRRTKTHDDDPDVVNIKPRKRVQPRPAPDSQKENIPIANASTNDKRRSARLALKTAKV